MYNFYVESESGYEVEYICSELDAVHFLITMLENNDMVKAYAIQEWTKDFSDRYLQVRKLKPMKEFLEIVRC